MQTERDLPFKRLGHFRIVGRIGQGGMGDVYRAHDESLDRHVAIKVLPSELSRDEDSLRRFRVEATAAANVGHPNVVPIHFIGQEGGHHFFAMRFIEGESLAQRLQRKRRLPVLEALEIIEQCLAGLAAAHDEGVIHRDVKPANVLIEEETGRVVLVDFGLVRMLGKSTRMTATGTIMGTADYIAPEQARGQAIDGRTDLYSLGVVFYQLLAGRLPFQADTPTAMIFQHAYEAPFELAEAAPGTPQPVLDLVARLLEKKPEDRYPDCQAVLDDIGAFREGRPLAQIAPQPADPARQTTELDSTPKLPSELELPPAVARLASGGRWQGVRDWAATIFRRHAPEFVQELQSTTQQVDGAVGEYERRRNRLAKLHSEARSFVAELARQIRSSREAVAQAATKAETAENVDEEQLALAAKGQCEESLAALETQHAEQSRNLDEIELQLDRADATLARLRSQRDVLGARLRAVEARQAMEGGRSRSKRRWPLARMAIAGTLVAAVLFVVVRVLFPTNRGEPETLVPNSPFERTRDDSSAGSGSAAAAQADREVITNSIGMRLVRIPAGEFIMGTSKPDMDVLLAGHQAHGALDDEHGPNECPAHEVFISQPFYMGVYEVTQEEYEQVMGRRPNALLADSPENGRYPVHGALRNEIKTFLTILSELPAEKAAGRLYRLPTEAEWEYACRAGTTGDFNFDDGPTPSQDDMNYNNHNTVAGRSPNKRNGFTMVGSYTANAFGLYDMHGNVWEWCSDTYVWDYYRRSPTVDPKGEIYGHKNEHVIRGGAFNSPAIHCRSAFRGHHSGPKLDNTAPDPIGFRVVCVEAVPKQRANTDGRQDEAR